MRVLIVDDVPQVRQALRQLLELSGEVEVVGEAANGREAICQVADLRPELVLLDLEMPQMNGYEACSEIKIRRPDCWVIAFSVHSYPEAREKARRAGADDFIEKGAPLAQILQRIKAR